MASESNFITRMKSRFTKNTIFKSGRTVSAFVRYPGMLIKLIKHSRLRRSRAAFGLASRLRRGTRELSLPRKVSGDLLLDSVIDLARGTADPAEAALENLVTARSGGSFQVVRYRP